mgnify:CR=1 FL=1
MDTTYLASTFALATPIVLPVLVLSLLTTLVIIQMRLSVSLEKPSRVVGVLLTTIDDASLLVGLMIVIESIMCLYIAAIVLMLILISVCLAVIWSMSWSFGPILISTCPIFPISGSLLLSVSD